MIVEIDLGVISLDLNELSIDEIDIKLEKEMKKKQRQTFKELLLKNDVFDESARTCPSCGKKMMSLGKVIRKIGTLAGDIAVDRRRLKCFSCKSESYPLDEKVGKGTKHSLPVIERALYLATELSYAKSSKALEKLTGAKISHGHIQHFAKEEGHNINKDLDKMASDLFGLGLDPGEVVKRSKDDTVVIAIDGGAIPDRLSQTFEAKVGVIYSLKTQISKNRVALVDRICYASLENAYKFGQKLFCLARRHGVLSAGRVLVIGDGARWIRGLIRDFFPTATYLLDIYHLKKKLKDLLKDDEYEALYQLIVDACLQGRPDNALLLLDKFVPSNMQQIEMLNKLKYYIRSNKVGISNYSRTDLFGSGSVEKAVDLIVSRRFKLRGMSWLRPGAAGMLALRLLRFNGQWDSYWKKRMGFAL